MAICYFVEERFSQNEQQGQLAINLGKIFDTVAEAQRSPDAFSEHMVCINSLVTPIFADERRLLQRSTN